MNAIEYEDLILGIALGMFQEFIRDLRVVQGWTCMVHFMVSIVPASVVVFCVDAIDRIFIRVARVDERVLRPIAEHHHDPGKQEGDQEHKKGRLPIHEPQSDAKQVVAELTECESHVKLLPLSAEKVFKGIDHSKRQKPANIF